MARGAERVMRDAQILASRLIRKIWLAYRSTNPNLACPIWRIAVICIYYEEFPPGGDGLIYNLMQYFFVLQRLVSHCFLTELLKQAKNLWNTQILPTICLQTFFFNKSGNSFWLKIISLPVCSNGSKIVLISLLFIL